MENFSTPKEKLIDRLESFMKEQGLNNNQLTIKANLSNGLIGKALKSRAAMNSDSIENILLSFPDLNADWLLTGRGKRYNSDTNDLSNTDELQKYLLQKVEKLEIEVRELTKRNGQLEAQLKLKEESNPRSKAI